LIAEKQAAAVSPEQLGQQKGQGPVHL